MGDAIANRADADASVGMCSAAFHCQVTVRFDPMRLALGCAARDTLLRFWLHVTRATFRVVNINTRRTATSPVD